MMFVVPIWKVEWQDNMTDHDLRVPEDDLAKFISTLLLNEGIDNINCTLEKTNIIQSEGDG